MELDNTQRVYIGLIVISFLFFLNINPHLSLVGSRTRAVGNPPPPFPLFFPRPAPKKKKRQGEKKKK